MTLWLETLLYGFAGLPETKTATINQNSWRLLVLALGFFRRECVGLRGNPPETASGNPAESETAWFAGVFRSGAFSGKHPADLRQCPAGFRRSQGGEALPRSQPDLANRPLLGVKRQPQTRRILLGRSPVHLLPGTARMLRLSTLAALLASSSLAAQAAPAVPSSSSLVAVLPLDARHAKIGSADRLAFEEVVRTIAGEVLGPRGYTVLTGETTLKVLADNGVDAAKACEASCALDAALEMKAELFISGSVTTTEGDHLAFVRLYESRSGRQLAAVRLEGRTLRDLRRSFEGQAASLFSPIAPSSAAGSPAAVSSGPQIRAGAVSSSFEGGPQVRSSAVTAAVGDLVIGTKPMEGAQLELIDPSGKKFTSASPYKNPRAQPGRWTVTAVAAGYEEERRNIDVPADELTALSLELNRLGGLSITGEPPGAGVVVTGPYGFRSEGGLPWNAEGLPRGTYRVAVAHSAHEGLRSDVEVLAGQTTDLVARLLRFGSLSVTGEPSGAAVLVTGPGGFRSEGGLPWEASDLPSGAYRVEVSRPGYETIEEVRAVTPGQSTQVAAVLRKALPLLPSRRPIPSTFASLHRGEQDLLFPTDLTTLSTQDLRLMQVELLKNAGKPLSVGQQLVAGVLFTGAVLLMTWPLHQGEVLGLTGLTAVISGIGGLALVGNSSEQWVEEARIEREDRRIEGELSRRGEF